MANVDVAGLRGQLVSRLLEQGQIRSPGVEEAFRAVPRHQFLPGTDPAQAYTDDAIVTKWSPDGRPLSSSSQPAVMATMLNQLDIRAGHRVLEIGTGTGYNAALLAHLVDDAGAVVSVEMDAELAEAARQRLTAAGYGRVTVICADGADGWPDGAPYDRIIVTAGACDLAPAWSAQLAAAGRIVLPLSLHGVQQSVAFERAGGHLVSASLVCCGFIPLQGALAGPDTVRALPEPGLFVRTEGGREPDIAALSAALRQPGDSLGTGVTVTASDLFGAFALWLGLHDPDAGEVAVMGPAADRGWALRFPWLAGAPALVGTGGLAAVVPAPDPGGEMFEASVRTYGHDEERLAPRLVAHIRDWSAAGRPPTSRLRIRAYPQGTGPDEAGAVVAMPHTRFLLDW